MCKWRTANATSRVNVGDRLRDCRTENIHTRNTLVIGFICCGILFHLIAVTLSRVLRQTSGGIYAQVYSRERLIWQQLAYMLSTSEVNFIAGYYNDCSTLFVLSFSFYFLVRVRCRRKESSRSLSHLLMSFLCTEQLQQNQFELIFFRFQKITQCYSTFGDVYLTGPKPVIVKF